MRTESGRTSSGHDEPAQRAAPTHADTIPVYIGFRLIRNGPEVTSRDTAWWGTTVVCRRSAVSAPEALRAIPPATSPLPTAAAAG